MKTLRCFLSMHVTFASLSSSDFALHAYLTLPSHLVRGMPLTLLPFTSNSNFFWSIALLPYTPHVRTTWYLLTPSVTHLFSHSTSAPHFFLHLSKLVSQHKLREHFIFIRLSSCLSSILITNTSASYITVGFTTYPYTSFPHPNSHSWDSKSSSLHRRCAFLGRNIGFNREYLYFN